MAWSNGHKKVVHIYKNYAEIPTLEYRQMLFESTGAMSSVHAALYNPAFDVFMRVLEFRAEQHYLATGKPLPAKMRSLRYWRDKNPGKGEMNTRQKKKIWEVWTKLRAAMPDPPLDPVAYMCGIVEQATHHVVSSFSAFTSADAGILIEALKCRLAQELRRAA